MGTPWGPGMGTRPIRVLPSFQAMPPEEIVRNQIEKRVMKIKMKKKRSELLRRLVWVPAMAGSVKTHHVVSKEDEGKSIVSDDKKRKNKGKDE